MDYLEKLHLEKDCSEFKLRLEIKFRKQRHTLCDHQNEWGGALTDAYLAYLGLPLFCMFSYTCHKKLHYSFHV